ncbi:MAG: hypothetical protein IBJ03_18945 [Gemmatimonadaceae bacterium]|nr:hypothetical protein [Gemmatimonadaceae bacterium]
MPTSSSVRPATPSRALVPVAPVRTRGPGMGQSPLSRSGIDVGDLLLTEDELAERAPSSPVAVEMGLERARGALVRQAPGDALAALDDIWHAEQSSEEGWYLRAGALTAMGLPGEGDRIAGEGLDRQPDSRALRFVQSVARLLVGDLSGARAVLTPAMDATPNDPVLVAQHAVVLARQGHGADARDALASLQAREPQHPALEWARRMVQSINADGTRQRVQHSIDAWPDDQNAVSQGPISDWPVDAAESEGATDIGVPSGDVHEQSFVRLGQLLIAQSPSTAATRIRSLIVAYSAGGHMAATVPPEPVHAARSILGALLSVVNDGDDLLPGSSSVARPVLASLWTMMQAMSVGSARSTRRTQSADDLERAARRMAPALPPAMRPLLDAIIRGASSAVLSRTSTTPTSSTSIFEPLDRRTPRSSEPIVRQSGEFAAVLHEERDLRAPLVPIRLGLSLLRETAADRAAERAFDRTPDRVTDSLMQTPSAPVVRFTPSHAEEVAVFGRDGRRSGSTERVQTPVGTELRGEGWGAAQNGAPREVDEAGGRRAGMAAIVLIGGAIIAVTQGAPVVAIALGLGAAWVGVRKG